MSYQDEMTAAAQNGEHVEKAVKLFYVEVAVDAPGRYDGKTFFRSSLQNGAMAKHAELNAIAEARQTYPDATEIAPFMSRIVTPEKGVHIAQKIQNGTWEGWFAA